jgi:histidinol-phosphate aminotransferase
VLVVVDEATASSTDPDAADGLRLYREPERRGAADLLQGLQAGGAARGFVIAPEPVADMVRRTSTPFGVSTIARRPPRWRRWPPRRSCSSVDAIVTERRVRAGPAGPGLDVVPSQANFLGCGSATTRPASPPREAVALTVRPFQGEGVRITIAEREADDRLIETAAAFRR